MSNATILVCCHKPDWFANTPGYLPIHAGKAISKYNLGIQGDDTGDNISEKNPNFCELTALYWLWKNGPHSKYVGLTHYRRYFDFKNKLPWGSAKLEVKPEDIIKNPPLIPDLDPIFKRYDIIIPMPAYFPVSAATFYCASHVTEDYDILQNVIKEKYPEYIPAFRRVMHDNKLSLYNMMITRRELFDEYCEWLFSILFEVEERIIYSPYPYQQRVFGFMSERLLNVWIEHKKLRALKLPVTLVTDNPNTYPNWKTGLVSLRWTLGFRIMNLGRKK
ncbi:MAG: DUF4422 domain-containing protein [Muribaculaceae bacterium]|nr:DUF4422 domain-containing protein [Muribaculaceae bacterium]